MMSQPKSQEYIQIHTLKLMDAHIKMQKRKYILVTKFEHISVHTGKETHTDNKHKRASTVQYTEAYKNTHAPA